MLARMKSPLNLAALTYITELYTISLMKDISLITAMEWEISTTYWMKMQMYLRFNGSSFENYVTG